MDIGILLNVLDAENEKYQYIGPKDTCVYSVQFQNGSYRYLDGILYFQRELSYPVPPKNICVIAGGHKLYEKLQKILTYYAKKESTLIQMQERLTAFRESETDMVLNVMENPCIFLKENFEPLIWGGFPERENFHWLDAVDMNRFKDKKSLQISTENASEKLPYNLMLVHYYNVRGKKRHIIVADRNKKFNTVIDPLFLKKICFILERYVFVENQFVHSGSRLEELLKSMITEIPVQRITIEKELAKEGWSDKKKYYILLIDVSLGERKAGDTEELAKRLDAIVFRYEKYYVCLLHGTLDVEYNSRTDLGINDFLAERNFYAGLSYGFFDIMDLVIYYRQAEKVVKILFSTKGEERYYAFAESIITYLVKESTGCNDKLMRSLCHPNVYRIYEFDKRNGTDYIEFLSAYIYSERNVQRTSENLHIHKNTVYQKIEKINEKFYLDVNDIYEYIKIYVSVLVIENLDGNASINGFLRWM